MGSTGRKTPGNSNGQFSLRSLFRWTTLTAVCILPFVIPPPLGLVLAFIGVMLVIQIQDRMNRVEWACFLLFGVIFLSSCVEPNWFPWKSARKRGLTPCAYNVRQLGLALLNYESGYGHFPPAYTIDENGNRLHSWRTLILPFLERQDLYDQIDFDLPWDHPANSVAAGQIPEVYRGVCDPLAKPNDYLTSYIGIIGKNTIWKNDGATTTFADMTDGTSNTVTIIESNQHRIHWMSPNDLQYLELLKLMNDPNYQLFKSNHKGGTNVARGDGSVSFARESISNKTIKSILIINDGQTSEF